MARDMGGSGYVTTGIGALVGLPAGSFSLWAICRATVDGTYRVLFSLETAAGSSRLSLWLSNTNTVQLTVAASDKDTGVAASSSDGWMLVGVSKASGSSVPRGHKYVYSTNTWTHTDAGAASGGDSGDLTAGRVQIGRWQTASERWSGDILLCGAAKRVLADGEWEQLPYTLLGAIGTAPDALWLLDQHATTQTVIDLTGGGANETALTSTAVSTSSVPVWSYGTGPSVGAGTSGGATTHSATATLTATATISPTAATDKPVAAALTATATRTVAADTAKPVTAAFTATATATVAAATTKPTAAALTATATLTAAAATAKGVAAALTVTAAMSSAATVGSAPVVDVAAAVGITATITAAAGASRPVASALAVTATLTASASAGAPASGLAGQIHGPQSSPPGAVTHSSVSLAGSIGA